MVAMVQPTNFHPEPVPPQNASLGVGAQLLCGPESPLPRGAHLGIAFDRVRPSSDIRFKALDAINASVACVDAWRAQSRPPTMNFHRKNVFSTRPWQW